MTARRRLRILFACAFLLGTSASRAEFLMQHYLTPSFVDDPAAYSAWWDVFYSPYNGANSPDIYATYGSFTTASAAGVTPPANSSPTNPQAYFDPRNATITQTGTNSAFIIGAGSTGNIYSFSAPTAFVLNDTHSTPIGTAVFQFQTSGTEVDFSSIKLVYQNSSGQTITLSAADQQYIREYRAGSSAFGGYDSRVAIQWNLTGLNVTSYQIVWTASGSSMSFQEALLDTDPTYAAVVPQARTWTASGNATWSTTANWQEGSASVANGNVKFNNPAATTITLDGSRTLGEMIFNNAGNVTLNSSAGSTITSNTGITTVAVATGSYTINANYVFNAFNLFHINAGTVTINGVVSGAYGLVKEGDGTLILSQNNTFTGASGVGVDGGVLKLGGTNAYTGGTSIQFGTLIVGANAGNTGALGNNTSNIALGADSTTFATVGAGTAKLMIEGNFTISRNVTLANGTFEKHLGALNATTGATYSGTIDFSTSTNAFLTAQNANDRVVFSGALSGSSTTAVTLDGLGTVEYSGVAKTYAGNTTVQSGTLRLASGTTFSGNGNFTVNSGASLLVNGSLEGTGTISLASNALLGGTGTVKRAATIGGGAILSPGEGIGALAFISSLTLASGGHLRWEINNSIGAAGTVYDTINITGSLAITAISANPFVIEARTLAGTVSGAMANFNSSSLYDWTLLTASGGITGFSTADFGVDLSGFTNSYSGQFSILQQGNSLVLHYAAAPEPSRAILLLAGILSLASRRRRVVRPIFIAPPNPNR